MGPCYVIAGHMATIKLLPENNGYISYGELSSAWRVGRDKNNPQRTKPDAERKGGVIENQTKEKKTKTK